MKYSVWREGKSQNNEVYAHQERIPPVKSAVRYERLVEGLCCWYGYERDPIDYQADWKGYEGTQLDRNTQSV